MHLDELLEKLNPYGRYQLLAWTLLAIFNCFPPAWNSFSIAFTGFYPTGFTCLLDNITADDSIDYSQFNSTTLLAIGYNDTEQPHCSRPRRVGHNQLNESGVSILPTANSGSDSFIAVLSEPCPSELMQYSKIDPITSSIVTEFNLVCSREIIFVIVSAAEGAGEILGCIIFGWLADLIGRKRAYFTAAATLIAGGAMCGLSFSWQLVGISRVVIGAGLIGMNNIGFVFASEMFPPKQRTFFATIHELVWGSGVVSLVGIGYYVRDWRHLSFVLTLPVISIIPLWWLIQESLHWLVSNEAKPETRRHYLGIASFNNAEEAGRIVTWIERFNRADHPLSDDAVRSLVKSHFSKPEPLIVNKQGTSQARPRRCSPLLATPQVRYITISVTLLWFANSLAYYGLQWSAQMLRADFYMSYFLLAFVELPSTIVVLLIMPRIGRRWTIFAFHIVAGICCIVVPFIPDTYSEVAVGVAIFGKFAVCSSFTGLYVFAVELFPTEIRGLGFGVSSLLGRIGLVVAPFVNWLGVGGEAIASVVRMLLYGIVLLAVALLIIPLPETNNCPLADTIEQTEHFGEYCASVQHHEASSALLEKEDNLEMNAVQVKKE